MNGGYPADQVSTVHFLFPPPDIPVYLPAGRKGIIILFKHHYKAYKK